MMQAFNLFSATDFRASTASQDWCGAAGAKELAKRIEEYWAERGQRVQIQFVDRGFTATMRTVRTDIRSDLVNGLPRKHASAPALPSEEAA